MKIKRYEPSKNSECLCGSGLKFKRCCFGKHLGYGSNENKQAIAYYNSNEFNKALIQIRIAITCYSILHKTNVDPFIKSNNAGVQKLLYIDIKAMTELLEIMFLCYRAMEQYDEFEVVCERLRKNITDDRWQKKITYYQILSKLKNTWPESVGKTEVKKLLPLDDESDPDIIQIYLHFHSDNISFKKKIQLFDRILTLVEDEGQILQYTVSKGIAYLEINDKFEAIEIIKDAIDDYEQTDNKDPCGSLKYAEAISLYGDLIESAEFKKKAIDKFTELLLDTNITNEYKSYLHYQIANCCYHIKKFSEAIDCYKSSLALDNKEITKVYMALTYCDMNNDKAIDIINSVNALKMTDSEKLDLIFNYIYISLQFNNYEMIKNSIAMLKNAPQATPYFEKVKSKLLLDISDNLNSKTNNNEGIKSFLRKMLSITNKYFILQPNIAGFGVNINAIIDNVTKKPNK